MSKSSEKHQLKGIDNLALDLGEEMFDQAKSSESSPSRPKLGSSRLSTVSLPAKMVFLGRTHSSLSIASSASSDLSTGSHQPTPLLRQDNHYTENNNIQGYKCQNNNNPSSVSTIGDHLDKQNRCIEISRQVLDQDTFAHQAGYQFYPSGSRRSRSLYQKIGGQSRSLCDECSPLVCIKSWVPILDWLPRYSIKTSLIPDIIAGITVAILHIPQGVAYSMLAGLGPVNGLYVSFFPVLIYALLGTSPHISVGTFAIASIMLNNIAVKMGATNNPTAAIVPSDNSTLAALSEASNVPSTLEVLTSVCLLCGFIQIAMGLMRLGSLSLILSEHLVSAFSTAIAFHVATSQFTSIFGFVHLPRAKSGPLKLIKAWLIMAEHAKQANLYTVLLSAISITILVLFKELAEPRLKKRCSFPFPIDLLLVIFSILTSWLFKFNQKWTIQIVEQVPTGLPEPTVPRFDLMPSVFVDSVVLSIVCFAVSLSLAKIFAKKHGYEVRANQELVALGAANAVSSFFLCYPCSAALSRSTLQEKVGGRTQVAGLVSSAIIMTVLLLLAPYLYHLPKFTLSCIVLVALKSMFMQLGDFKTFWRISKLDGASWLITFFSVIILDIDLGLIVGITVSILAILIRLALPKVSMLGHLSSTEIYAESESYQNLTIYPGVQIVRFNSPLFYLNVDLFKEKALNTFTNSISPLSLSSKPKYLKRTLVLDFSGVSFVDKAGLDALVEVVRTMQSRAVSTALVACPQHIAKSIERINFANKVKHTLYPFNMYPTVHDAVIDVI